MPKIFTHAQLLDADVVDAYCRLQKEFTDQFVYYDKQRKLRCLGLGRCVALPSMGDVESIYQGPEEIPPVLFTFTRFDAENPAPSDELFASYPRLRFMLPEIVLVENERGAYLQVNSLGPVYPGRVARFAQHAAEAGKRRREDIPYRLEMDSREDWSREVAEGLAAIRSGRVGKVVLSRRVNLIDGSARGVVFLYRYGDVFFCGCTPELLVRKTGNKVESECLAGTCPQSSDPRESKRLAEELLADGKNRREHAFVVDFVRAIFDRNCHDVHIPEEPGIKSLPHVQHLHTPVRALMMDGRSVQNLAGQLAPTPALSGSPVGEAMMLLRQIEPFNRGFFGSSIGFVDAAGDGAFSVAIRSGVFDGEMGYLYAGCGIVEGSDADSEYDEVELKLQTILSAFDGSAE